MPDIRHFADLFRWEKRLLARFLFTSLGRAVANMAVIFLIQEFLSSALGHRGRVTTQLALLFGIKTARVLLPILLVAAFLVTSLLNYDNKVVQQKAVKVLELGMMHRLMAHLLTLSVPFFNRQTHGDLLQAVRQDITQLRMSVYAVTNVFLESILVIGLLITTIWLSPILAFWSLVGIPLASLPVFWFARKLRAKSYSIRRSGYVFLDVIMQMLTGIRVIKAYQAEANELKTSLEKGRAYFDDQIDVVRIRALAQVLLENVAGAGIVAAIVIGGVEVKNGILTFPSLLAFVMALRALHGPLNNIYTYYTELQTYRASLHRVRELLSEKPDVVERPGAVALASGPKQIRFENVSFGYDSRLVLKDVNFEVNAGETIAIVGPSGTGKSTLLNLIVRFYDPTSGAIRFDGRDLRDFKLASVYSKVAIVTQDPFMFAATVADNIRYGRPGATDEEVSHAARAAYIHDEIVALPQGYQTKVGVGGRELSRGQAQRINVARAILKAAPILLLDEATSSLDSVSEAQVQAAIDGLVHGRTSFVVAHRLSTIRNADRLLVLEPERVAGFGTHEHLIANCELYRQLWEAQGTGFAAREMLA